MSNLTNQRTIGSETCVVLKEKDAAKHIYCVRTVTVQHVLRICCSYTMGCPPVRGDNPRALASGLSYVQVDKHGITFLYHLH